jgi:hypothetical protein
MGGPGSGGNHGGGRRKKTSEEKAEAKAAKAAKLKADNAGKTPWTHCAKRRRVEEVEEVEEQSQELELEVGEMNSATNELAQTAAGIAAINLAPEAKGALSNFTHEFATAMHKEGLHLTNKFNSMLSQQYQGIGRRRGATSTSQGHAYASLVVAALPKLYLKVLYLI